MKSRSSPLLTLAAVLLVPFRNVTGLSTTTPPLAGATKTSPYTVPPPLPDHGTLPSLPTLPSDADILVRSARGEDVERTPVWLMRQAGRYQQSFRHYSEAVPFRVRSESPEIASELSLQCVRQFGMDGCIMFSDILTPLPVMGIDFDVIRGTGPVISTQVRTLGDVRGLSDDYNFGAKVPFVGKLLGSLKEKTTGRCSLVGFVGAPFTLASYTIEGKSSKNCLATKKMMMSAKTDGGALPEFLDRLAQMIGEYGCYQIESGAEVVQVFESWAHQLTPGDFEEFAKPAAKKAIRIMKEKHPDVPVIFFANGGSSYLELQRDMGCDMIAVDWSVDMATARKALGPDVPISGNIDPRILFGTEEQIRREVRSCIDAAGGPGKHLLNLGHGVMQGTPEEAVGWLVDECKNYRG